MIRLSSCILVGGKDGQGYPKVSFAGSESIPSPLLRLAMKNELAEVEA